MTSANRAWRKAINGAKGGGGNKYKAKKKVVDGITFDSIREFNRYLELKLLERSGEIENIKPHPRFELIIDGKRIGRYTADFQYELISSGEIVVEDVKSKPTMTEAFSLRKRVFEALYPGIKLKILF